MINSAEEFVALRSSSLKDDYDGAAMEEAPIGVWRDVISQFPEYRPWVARNKTISLEILEELCEFDPRTRWFAASKRKLSTKLFERLSQDDDPDVRVAICANKKAPLEILEKMTHDSDENVARIARKNYERRKSQRANYQSGDMDEHL
jgi:hypothetical protein